MHRKLIVVGLALLFLLGTVPLSQANPYAKEQREMTLLESLEDLLHRQAALLTSFESMIRDGLTRGLSFDEVMGLMYSFEALLKGQEERIRTFEDLIARDGATLKLLFSLEALLHEQCDLKFSFEDLIQRVGATEGLLKSFEALIRSDADLVHRFGQLITRVRDHIDARHLAKLLFSFEDLLHCQDELIARFEAQLEGKGKRSHQDYAPHKRDHHKDAEVYWTPRAESSYDHRIKAEVADVWMEDEGRGKALIVVRNDSGKAVSDVSLVARTVSKYEIGALRGSYTHEVFRQSLDGLEPGGSARYEVSFTTLPEDEFLTVQVELVAGE